MGGMGFFRIFQDLGWPMMWTLLAGLIFSLFLVTSRIYARELLVGRRQREDRVRDQRIQPLMNAYRILAGGLRDAPPDADPSAIDGALSDVVLLGNTRQVELASRCAQELLTGGPPPFDLLAAELRGELRGHLGLLPIPSSIELPRFVPSPNRQLGGGGGGGGGGRRGGGGGGGA